MKIRLSVKPREFKLIASGEITEIYRGISGFWTKRLTNETGYKDIDTVVVSHLSVRRSDQIEIEVKGIEKDYGKQTWGAQWGVKYYVIKLGKTLWQNIEPPKEVSYEARRR